MADTGIGFPTAYRRETLLLVPRGAVLPDCCIKCGFPAEAVRLHQTFSWAEPLPWWMWISALVPVLHVAVSAAVRRERLELSVPLCEQHHRRRGRALWIGWGLITGGILFGAFSGDLLPEVSVAWRLLAMIASVFAGAVFLTSGRALLSVVKIDKQEAIFAGAGDPFLAQLPPG